MQKSDIFWWYSINLYIFFNFACRTFDVCYSSYIMIFTLYIFVFVVCVVYTIHFSHFPWTSFCNKSRRNEKKNHGNFWHSTIRLIFSSNSSNRILNYHSFRTHWKCDGTRGVFARKFLGSMVATSLITIKEGFAPRNAITMPFYSAMMMMMISSCANVRAP